MQSVKTTNQTESINRNIVECKDMEKNCMRRWKRSINRNIVECKGRKAERSDRKRRVLIET